MAAPLSLFASATGPGFRASRYGDFVILKMQSAGFAVSARDLQAAEAWARARSSMGSMHRDRTAFIDRFETVLARSGSGFATKGASAVLRRLVQGMEQAGIDIKEYTLPPNLNESVEIVKKKPPAAAAPAAVAGGDPVPPSPVPK